MSNPMTWSLGLCCGVPLLAALVLGGAAVDGSDRGALACLSVAALLTGYVAFRFFAGPAEDEQEMDEPAPTDGPADRTRP